MREENQWDAWPVSHQTRKSITTSITSRLIFLPQSAPHYLIFACHISDPCINTSKPYILYILRSKQAAKLRTSRLLYSLLHASIYTSPRCKSRVRYRVTCDLARRGWTGGGELFFFCIDRSVSWIFFLYWSIRELHLLFLYCSIRELDLFPVLIDPWVASSFSVLILLFLDSLWPAGQTMVRCGAAGRFLVLVGEVTNEMVEAQTGGHRPNPAISRRTVPNPCTNNARLANRRETSG
jgi:hypothetical protein